MPADEYTKLPWPGEGRYLVMRCACCGAEPEAWQYITAEQAVQRVVMCSTTDLEPFSKEPEDLNADCPFSFPSRAFYKGTLREAVAHWNKVHGLLVMHRMNNALPSAEGLS